MYREVLCILPSSSGNVNIIYNYSTILKSKNLNFKETDIGTIHRTYSDFTSYTCMGLCMCVCVSLCNFITGIASYNHHHNQDTLLSAQDSLITRLPGVISLQPHPSTPLIPNLSVAATNLFCIFIIRLFHEGYTNEIMKYVSL